MAEITASTETGDLYAIDSNEKQYNQTADATTKDVSLDSQKNDPKTPLKVLEEPGNRGSIRRMWRLVQRYIWDDPDKPEEEKKFLLKLDVFLLSYSCLGYFCKNLDQANLSNAYVSVRTFSYIFHKG